MSEAVRPELQSASAEHSITINLLGRRITFMTATAIINAIHDACVMQQKITVANYNVHSFNLSMQLPWFYDFLQSAEIAHCDGMGILKAARYLGLDIPIEYRVSYSFLIPRLLEHSNQCRFSVFLLGTKQENLDGAIRYIRVRYPNIEVDGHHGYFDTNDPRQNQAVIDRINAMKPNILLVGMGMPVQESWVWQHRKDLQTNAILPGGAVIDRLAGTVPDCPSMVSDLGFEWLYRLMREPKRLAVRYLAGNPAFVLHLALAACYSSPLEINAAKVAESMTAATVSESISRQVKD